MVYKKAQDRFANRADRMKLISAFYENLVVLADQIGVHPRVEITKETAATAATFLYLTEGMTRGFRIGSRNDTDAALRRIANAHRGHSDGGISDSERELLKSAIECRFVTVTADDHAYITRYDDKAEWALGLDGIGIAQAAAYALLGEKPKR